MKEAEVAEAILTPRLMFSSPHAHPLALDVILLDAFGPEWLSWEATTIWSEIKSEFGTETSAPNRNKINAVKTLHLVNTPWTQWEVFTLVIVGLNGEIPDFKILVKPSVSQLIAGIRMINQVKEQPFGEEVARYVAACFLEDGVFYLPPPAHFGQRFAEQTQYRCKKCGNIDLDTENDMCDTCGAPQSELEKEPTFDPTPIRHRFHEVYSQGYDREDYLEENVVDVQVAKLLVAFEYSKAQNAALREQLEAFHAKAQ